MEQSILDKPVNKLLALNWEKALYIILITLALVTRLWGLGDRVPSHDESIHTLYSWNLYTGKGFAHHPLMHGPFQFHAAALSYFLFSDNDFTARIPVALMGTAIVFFPYLLRRWLGRAGALATSFFLLISPSIAYYSRYIREDIPVLLWTLVSFLGMILYLHDGRKRWLFLMAAGVSLMFATKEVAFIHGAIFGFFLISLSVVQTFKEKWPNEDLKAFFLAALGAVVIGLLVIGLSQVLRPELPAAEAVMPEEQAAPVQLDQQPALPVWDIAKAGGGLLAGIGFLAAIGFLLAGKLRQSDLSFSVPWFFALLAAMALGLLVLGVDGWLDTLFSMLALPQPLADVAAIWGRVLIWTALLAVGVYAIYRYLIHRGAEPSQIFIAVLIIAVVVVGVLVRVGIPVLLSIGSCGPQENLWGCAQQSLQTFAWPAGSITVAGISVDARLLLTLMPFVGGIVVGLAWLAVTAFQGNRAFDLVVFLGSFCLPFLSPLLINLVGLKSMEYNPPTIYYSGAFLIEVLVISVVIGLLWDRRSQMEGGAKHSWLIAAAIHYTIFVLLFTTFLTNAYGIASGFVGSLGYWLEQQEVERGGQPRYYYVIMVSLYEYLPLLLSLATTVYLLVRGLLLPRLQPWIKRLGEFPAMKGYFIPFVLWWVALSWVGYSVAGERMPWLTVHLALPMILLSGWLVGRLLEEIDWQRVRQSKAWLIAMFSPPFVIAIVVLIDAMGHNPFQGYNLAQLQASGRFMNALLGVLVCGVGLGYVFWRSGWQTAARILLLTVLLVPVFVTVRTAWRFCYVNYDYPTEFLVYAHAAPGVREAMNEIEEISQRYGGGPYAIDVPYGSDGSTLFHWQLRYYPPDYSFGDNPSRDELDAPVIIAGSAQWDVVSRYVGDGYVYRTYTYIWWPMQDYWNLNWERIKYAVTNSDMRAALWDIWYNRDYTRYDQVTGKTHTLDKWPLRGDFRLYIRHDVAEQAWDISSKTEAAASAGAYAEGWQDLAARQVITGIESRQFKNPRGIKVGPDGFLYVADTGNNRIQKLTLNGQFVATWSQSFFEPWDVAVAPDGSIYVADTWNHRIQRLDAEGHLLNVWGAYGEYINGGNEGPGAFYGPRGIAIGPDGLVYVADTGNKRIQVFEPDGQYVLQWGGGGALEGYLDEPVGIAFGPQGEVYVADTWNRRVQVFSRGGLFLREWPIEGWDASLQPEKTTLFNEEKPYLAVDANGYVYVTDPANYRVLVFDAQGNYKLSFGKYGLDDSSFMLPTGIAVADDGTIYVSDAHGSRVLVFNPLDLEKAGGAPGVVAPKLKFPSPGAEIPAGKLTLVGTSIPNSQVQIILDDRSVAIVAADADGIWTLPIELIEPGAHVIVLHVFAWAPETGTVEAVSDPIQLVVLAGAGKEETPPAPPMPVLEEGGKLYVGELTLTGTGAPDSEVRVVVGGEPVGIAQVDADGNWSLSVALDEPGDYEVVVEALDSSGAVVATSEPAVLTIVDIITITPTVVGCSLPPGSCTGDTFTVRPGDTLGCISRCAGVALEALLAANPEIADPDLILPGQIIVIPR